MGVTIQMRIASNSLYLDVQLLSLFNLLDFRHQTLDLRLLNPYPCFLTSTYNLDYSEKIFQPPQRLTSIVWSNRGLDQYQLFQH